MYEFTLGKKISKKNLVKLPYSAKKTATESLKPYTVFCIDLQSCVKIMLYKLGCKCLTTSYSYRNKAKRPEVLHISKTNGFAKFFSCNALNSTISNVIPMPSCLYPLTSSVNACPA